MRIFRCFLCDIVFALVTASGSLIIYSMHVPSRAMAKIAAHTVDATCLDWHPTRPYVIATGGAGDRCVKGTWWGFAHEQAYSLFVASYQELTESSIGLCTNE